MFDNMAPGEWKLWVMAAAACIAVIASGYFVTREFSPLFDDEEWGS